MPDPSTDSWIIRHLPNPSCRVRLFCFPHAGGGASQFRGWPALLPASIELCAIQLPGRETRMREPPYVEVETLAADLIPAMRPWLDRPFALFGHSMGALLAFECARRLRDIGRHPSRLYVAACRAPHLPLRRPPLRDAPDAALLDELRMLGGSPDEVLNSAELMAFLLPLIRADLRLFETYRHAQSDTLTIPIVAFGGREDAGVPDDDIDAWRNHSSGRFARHMLPGGHFFAQGATEQLVRLISDDLIGAASLAHGG